MVSTTPSAFSVDIYLASVVRRAGMWIRGPGAEGNRGNVSGISWGLRVARCDVYAVNSALGSVRFF